MRAIMVAKRAVLAVPLSLGLQGIVGRCCRRRPRRCADNDAKSYPHSYLAWVNDRGIIITQRWVRLGE